MTLENALNLSTLFTEISSLQIPIKISYKLAKISKWVEEQQNFYQTEFDKILKLYCEEDENGKPQFDSQNQSFKIKDDFAIEAHEKINELSTLEIEIPNISFTLEELDSFQLSFKSFNLLLPFIKE